MLCGLRALDGDGLVTSYLLMFLWVALACLANEGRRGGSVQEGDTPPAPCRTARAACQRLQFISGASLASLVSSPVGQKLTLRPDVLLSPTDDHQIFGILLPSISPIRRRPRQSH